MAIIRPRALNSPPVTAQIAPGPHADWSSATPPPGDRAHTGPRAKCAAHRRAHLRLPGSNGVVRQGLVVGRLSLADDYAWESPRGGARADRASGTSVGRPRCRKMRRVTTDSSRSAIRRSRPPQRGHANTCVAGDRAGRCVSAIDNHQRGHRHVRRGPSRRHRAGNERCVGADTRGRNRRPRPVPDPRRTPGYLHRHVRLGSARSSAKGFL